MIIIQLTVVKAVVNSIALNRNIDMSMYLDPSKLVFDKTCKYDLLANIVHDGLPGAGKGTYRMYFYHKVQSLAMLIIIITSN